MLKKMVCVLMACFALVTVFAAGVAADYNTVEYLAGFNSISGETGDIVTCMAEYNNYLFVGLRDKTAANGSVTGYIKIYDNTNPASPVFIKNMKIRDITDANVTISADWAPLAMTVRDKFLFVVWAGYFITYDVSNINNIQQAMRPSNYVAANNAQIGSIADVSCNDKLAVITYNQYDTGRGNTVFRIYPMTNAQLTDSTGASKVYYASYNKQETNATTTDAFVPARKVKFNGDILYVVGGYGTDTNKLPSWGKILAVDTTTPAAPVVNCYAEMKKNDTYLKITDLVYSGSDNNVYICTDDAQTGLVAGDRGVFVIDMTKPGQSNVVSAVRLGLVTYPAYDRVSAIASDSVHLYVYDMQANETVAYKIPETSDLQNAAKYSKVNGVAGSGTQVNYLLSSRGYIYAWDRFVSSSATTPQNTGYSVVKMIEYTINIHDGEGAPVESIISATDSITVDLNVNEVFNRDMSLVVAVYNNNTLVDVIIRDQSPRTVELPVEQFKTYDNIKVMIWSGFNDMIPYKGMVQIPWDILGN